MLSQRMQDNVAFSVEEAEKFKEAVEIIIQDSKLYLPPPRPKPPIDA